ncbi:hypothetical protein ACLW9W_004670, partial [Escherichia coli]
RQKQKKLETMIWQPEFTDKTLSRKPGRFTCKVSFQTDNEMRICDKFQSKIHKTDILLFSGEQSIPETEYLVKAVYYTGCKQHGHQGPCCLQHTLVAKESPSKQH